MLNNEWCWGYRENEPLDGYDPYSNSKSCSELVTHSYINSFYNDMDVAVSTARAGNVIGGGDYAPDRIIPDCVRAANMAACVENGFIEDKEKLTDEQRNGQIIVRNPYSTRPYQHVLEPLNIYLTIVKAQYEDKTKAGFYNVGPDDSDCVTTGDIVDKFCGTWNKNGSKSVDDLLDGEPISFGEVSWINRHDGGPHEANFLKLDCSLIKQVFGWKPVWNIDKAIEMVVQFEQNTFMANEAKQYAEEMDREIAEFFGE